MRLFDGGFRPFFMAAAAWAAGGMALWLCMLGAAAAPPTLLAGTAWHAHEMLFGYATAVLAGFLLTAIPNWTGRLPLRGWPLAALAGLWLAGRGSVLASAWTGPWVAATIDVGFAAALVVVALREIAASRNWRNLVVVAGVAAVGLGNLTMHAENAGWLADGGYGWRLGLGSFALLIAVVGGRIVPSFTRNWLAKRGAARLPAPLGRLDKAAVLAQLAATLAWVAVPDSRAAGGLLVLAGILALARLARWRGLATAGEPLLLVLHAGYAWLGVGLVALGAAGLTEAVPASAGMHALTAGAIGSMTLAVMARASLGHTGRDLTAGRMLTTAFAAVFLAAALRVGSTWAATWAEDLLAASGLLWIGAFALFLARLAPVLVGRPLDGHGGDKPGHA